MGNRKPGQNWDRLLAVAGRARSRLEPSSSARNPTVARHIQALEDELNSRLFRKTSTGYGLTDFWAEAITHNRPETLAITRLI